MKDLSSATGIGSDANYLNGNIVDNQTEINAFVNQDLIQFFQKLAGLASITFNDLEDNETNGYQLLTALEFVVRSYVASETEKGTVEKADSSEGLAGTVDKFMDALRVQALQADNAAMLLGSATNLITSPGALSGIYATPAQSRDDTNAENILVPRNLTDHEAYTEVTVFGDVAFSQAASNKLSYKRMNNGLIEISGNFDSSGVVGTDTAIFTLPVGYESTFDVIYFDLYDVSTYTRLAGIVNKSDRVVYVREAIPFGTYSLHINYLQV